MSAMFVRACKRLTSACFAVTPFFAVEPIPCSISRVRGRAAESLSSGPTLQLAIATSEVYSLVSPIPLCFRYPRC